MAAVGVALVALGTFGIVVPFVGPPIVGLGSEPETAWAMTQDRLVRHVIPGVAVVAGGVLLLPHKGRVQVLGTVLALLGGIWFTVAPIVHGQLAAAPSRFLDMFGALGYHYGTGVLITALAAFALGRANRGRERARSDAPVPSSVETSD